MIKKTHFNVYSKGMPPKYTTRRPYVPRATKPKPKPKYKPKSKPRRKMDEGLMKISRLTFRSQNHIPMPQQFYTTITASAAGYITAGGATQFQQSFPANWTYHPFASSPAAGAITWFQITAATYNPPGHSFFLNNSLYNRAICFANKIEIDVIPESTGDVCDVSITPAVGVGVPSTYASAATAAFTKAFTSSAGRQPGNAKGEYPMVHYCKHADFLGVSKIVYNSDTGIYDYINASPPTKTVYWSVNVQSADNTAWTFPVPFRIRLTYFVKFYDLSAASFSA